MIAPALLLVLLPAVAQGPEVPAVPRTMTAEEARPAMDRAVAWLLETQNEDGSWATGVLEGLLDYGFSVETYYAWQVAGGALACMALMEVEDSPERRAALERGLEWLCTTRAPKRGSDWDSDFVWSGLYGLVACVEATGDPRLQSGEWRLRIEQAGRRYLDLLVENQIPTGGWAYYDDPIYSRRPKWGTSFCTALVLPALGRALELGWIEDPGVLERARVYVARCALPNGAFEYDLNPIPRISGGEHINGVKGSLGRIQVCNWGLAEAGERKITPDRIREGLERFFEHHRFLDVARMRPIPHEAYYANAGYFYFFGHYYAARAINLLPEDQREAYHGRLRPHLVKTQRGDGSTSDFLGSGSLVTASTSYLALSLALGMDPVEN